MVNVLLVNVNVLLRMRNVRCPGSTVDPVITFLVALLRANYEGVALKKWWNKYKNHFMK